MTLSGASAQEKAPEKAEVRGTILVQLRSFSVPVVNSAGGRAQGPISLFLVVRGEQNFTTICHNLPRIREAIALTVDQSPILVIEGKYQLDEIGLRLYREINRALPSPMVINLHLLPMARRLGEGAVNLELRGSNKDCMGIQKLPLDVATMLRAENPVARTFTVAEPEAAPKPEAKPRAKPKSKRRRDTAPAVIAPTLKSETPIQKTPNPDACQGLADVWKASSHTVSGTRYWLDRAFTLDENNDGVVDNVGFILKAEDKADITIYYFPGPGRQSLLSAPGLRLEDDRKLAKICFGQEDFKKPEPEKKGEKPGTFQVPDLAAELAAKARGGKAEGVAVKTKEKTLLEGPGLVFAIAIGAGVLLVAGGGVGYAIARWRRDRRRKERRAKRDRREGGRRQEEGAFEGPDKRAKENRREQGNRRTEDNRRKKKNRRGS